MNQKKKKKSPKHDFHHLLMHYILHDLVQNAILSSNTIFHETTVSVVKYSERQQNIILFWVIVETTCLRNQQRLPTRLQEFMLQ